MIEDILEKNREYIIEQIYLMIAFMSLGLVCSLGIILILSALEWIENSIKLYFLLLC